MILLMNQNYRFHEWTKTTDFLIKPKLMILLMNQNYRFHEWTKTTDFLSKPKLMISWLNHSYWFHPQTKATDCINKLKLLTSWINYVIYCFRKCFFFKCANFNFLVYITKTQQLQLHVQIMPSANKAPFFTEHILLVMTMV